MSQNPDPSEPDGATLAALAELLAAVSEIALREGVKLQSLIDLTKIALVRAALDLAAEAGSTSSEFSDSKLSVMTGVHRKDLRMLRSPEQRLPIRRKNLAAEVYARWMSDPRFLTRKGRPRVLPRQTLRPGQPSFESLVASVSSDVHPRAVLDELTRLGIVRDQGRQRARGSPSTCASQAEPAETAGTTDAATDPNPGSRTVRIIARAFTPSDDRSELLRFLVANAADHLRAGRANLDQGSTAFLEQAIYSDRLSRQSADEFNRLTMSSWEQAFGMLMPALRRLYDADLKSGADMDRRVRFGMYGYVAQADPEVADPARRSRPRTRSGRKVKPGP